MRNLTTTQKKILDKFINSQKETLEWKEAPFTNGRYGLSVEDLPDTMLVELEAINDTEILFQNVERYLSDKSFEYKRNK